MYVHRIMGLFMRPVGNTYACNISYTLSALSSSAAYARSIKFPNSGKNGLWQSKVLNLAMWMRGKVTTRERRTGWATLPN